jgi:stearoyl-CoA desaturase (delta-9 desaturase)
MVTTEGARAARPWWRSLLTWVDNSADVPLAGEDGRRIDWLRVAPFVAIHVSCLAVFWVGVSPTAVAVAAVSYAVRMFAVTGFYHRYFAHRAFKTSRGTQFIFAIIGATAAQRGALWWAGHHRHHHAHSDRAGDAHSPARHGLLWSHMGWFLARENFATKTHLVRDLLRFPELRFLDRFDALAPVTFAAALWAVGAWLEAVAPELGVTAAQLVIWGFSISTVFLMHATFAVNSLAHAKGSRRYATRDSSRNHFGLALLTFGEGWHNNHHHFPSAARQGFFWWEVDLTYYLLKALAAWGVIWELRAVPERVRSAIVERSP